MADGDLGITFTIAGSGGATKSITIAKASYDLAKAYAATVDEEIGTDAEYLVYEINKSGMGIINRANKQQNAAAIPTEKTLTKAT